MSSSRGNRDSLPSSSLYNDNWICCTYIITWKLDSHTWRFTIPGVLYDVNVYLVRDKTFRGWWLTLTIISLTYTHWNKFIYLWICWQICHSYMIMLFIISCSQAIIRCYIYDYIYLFMYVCTKNHRWSALIKSCFRNKGLTDVIQHKLNIASDVDARTRRFSVLGKMSSIFWSIFILFFFYFLSQSISLQS